MALIHKNRMFAVQIFIQLNFNKINLNKTNRICRKVISMFIGRERELASLKEFYEKDRIGG